MGDGEKEEEDGEGDEEGSSDSDSDGEDFDPDALPESLQTKMAAPPTLAQLPPPPPPGPPPLFAPRFPPPGIGIPPGPPPGLPPGLRPPAPAPSSFTPPRVPVAQPHIQSQAVLSSLPSRQKTPSSSGPPLAVTLKVGRGGGATAGKGGQRTVISAQPQLRNIQAEVTKFMPTSLRVRREVPKPMASKMKVAKPPGQSVGASGVGVASGRGKERGGLQGDAYNAFMKEMEGFL